ncbi:hypothetical protein JCM19298_1547 [Nonlabens ulvanivorans]|nr:hypothetical protein [Nonlabens ulvanivorans]GAK94419.1 hypothetical protein JCM19298_1547 [Nonlabens ulvanivorans]
MRSSKRNLYDEELDEFSIVNEIDENYQELLTSEIRDKMNLISAIEDKALYMYPVESSI